MSDLSQADMQQLWGQAGGDPSVAPLMSAIAMAESGGNPQATNSSSGACGLWQIYPCESGAYDPMTNAQIAVRKYKTQGLGAWTTYTDNSYKQYYNGSSNAAGSSGSSGSCSTMQILGNCADGFIGSGALLLGIGVVVTMFIVMVVNTREAQSLLKTGANVATTAAMVVPK